MPHKGKSTMARSTWVLLVVTLLLPLAAFSVSPTAEVARVLSGCGGSASDGLRTTQIVVAQASPLGYSANDTYLNQGGFLHGSTLAPQAKHDSDGDGLQDWTELIGTAYASGTPVTPSSPTLRDSDGDGIDDREEYLTGTNPNDPLMFLHILNMGTASNGLSVMTFAGRNNFIYEIIQADTVSGLKTNPTVAATVLVAGGVAPWYQTLSTVTNPTPPGTTVFTGIRKGN